MRFGKNSWIKAVAACGFLAAGLPADAARACKLALVLAVDVSGSVDPGEYRIQMEGLAEALRDGVVSEALVRARARIALVQWSGSSRQVMAIPWREIVDFAAADAFAAEVGQVPREWWIYSTAIGEALRYSLSAFGSVSDCDRLVIDLSGDGRSNEGEAPAGVLPALQTAGVTVNALAIEGAEDDLAGYFRENVITGEGAFVVTAKGFREYAEKMRLKLRRETTTQISLFQLPKAIHGAD